MFEAETIGAVGGRRSGGARWRDTPDDVLAAAAVDDLDAFAEIIRRHQQFVFGAAMRILRNPAISEEIAQETFIRAHRALGTFRGDSQLRSWLYRIATNLAKNAVTRRREFAAESIEQPADTRGPAVALEQKTLRQDIEAAIERLPEHQRVPFVMREFEHMSYQEIAEATGLRLNTVRTRILRARRALRSELEEWR